MHDDDAPLVAAATPQPPRRRGVWLAMVGLLAVAGVGLATRLDGPDSRIQVVTDPAADGPGGATTALLPDDTGGTSHDDLGTASQDGAQASPPPTVAEIRSITTGTPLPVPDPSVRGTIVDPAAYGPLGTARVTLACGDTAETREVTGFEADTTATGAPVLYWSEPAGRLHPLRPGDQFPAGSRLSWAVTGIHLGPWAVDDETDPCGTPVPAPTTPSHYTVPPTSITSPVPGYDQAWTARATLACGDTPGTRRVTSFDATTNGAGTANVMEWDPANGRIRQLAVGDVFPVTHVLSWAIQGVLLGPWPVPQVTDGC